MKRFMLTAKVVSFFTLASLIYGCGENLPKIKMYYSDTDVVGEPYKKTDQINIDVYIDATTSMEGFAVNAFSKYSQFLDQVETSGLAAWKNADIKYFKFGEKIKPIDRTEFLSAKNNLQFYREPGIFKDTYIDSVVKNTDTKRLSVLITDLFQTDGDVNTMVEKIKQKCFANNIAVGIIGIKTDFNGRVYDVPGKPSYGLTTTDRPFYAIVFGNNNNLGAFFDALETKPFVNPNQEMIISRYIIQSFSDSLTKTRDSRFVNKKTASSDLPYVFDFSMKKEGKDAKFNFAIDLKRKKRSPDFNEKNLVLVAYKKSLTDAKVPPKDSVLTNDFTIENLTRKGDKLSGVLTFHNEDGVGNYSYIVYLKANELNGLQTPQWIKDFSTENPVPNTPSAAQTFNLDKLAATLLIANASISPTYVAKFYINIFKR